MESLIILSQKALVEHTLSSLAIGSLLAVLLYVVGNEILRSQSRISGLKGPRGLPIFGNLIDIWSNAALKYQEWAKEYGDVYQVQLGNTSVVVVNSAATAKELFISNSQALSSRPISYTFHKVCCTRNQASVCSFR